MVSNICAAALQLPQISPAFKIKMAQTSEAGCARNLKAPGAVAGGSRSGAAEVATRFGWRRSQPFTALSTRRSAPQAATRCRTACKQHCSVAASHLCRCVTTGAGATLQVRRNSSNAAWLVRRRPCGDCTDCFIAAELAIAALLCCS